MIRTLRRRESQGNLRADPPRVAAFFPRRYLSTVIRFLGTFLLVAGCGSNRPSGAPDSAAASPAGSFVLGSSAFEEGGRIPSRYTCDGEDLSPPLWWRNLPAGTQSLALIFDDPDAVDVVGFTWVHWVLFNVPATADSLAAGIPPQAELADGSRQGRNSWPRTGYGGPCPPRGEHRYIFRLYALDRTVDLPAGAAVEQLRQRMAGHVLGATELTGLYRRNNR